MNKELSTAHGLKINLNYFHNSSNLYTFMNIPETVFDDSLQLFLIAKTSTFSIGTPMKSSKKHHLLITTPSRYSAHSRNDHPNKDQLTSAHSILTMYTR